MANLLITLLLWAASFPMAGGVPGAARAATLAAVGWHTFGSVHEWLAGRLVIPRDHRGDDSPSEDGEREEEETEDHADPLDTSSRSPGRPLGDRDPAPSLPGSPLDVDRSPGRSPHLRC